MPNNFLNKSHSFLKKKAKNKRKRKNRKAKIEKQTKKIKECLEEKETLILEKKTLEEEKKTLILEKKSLEEENNRLRQQIRSIEEVCVFLKDQMQLLNIRLSQLENNNDQLKREVNRLRKKNTRLQKQVVHLEELSVKHKGHNKELQTQLEHSRRHSIALEQQIRLLEQEIGGLVKTNQDLVSECAQMEEDFFALQEGHASMKQQLEKDRVSSVVGTNAVKLIKMISPYTDIRKPMMQVLSKNLIGTEAAKHFGVHKSTISRSRSVDIEALTKKWAEKKTRTKRAPVHLIVNHWKENCQIPSGSNRKIWMKKEEWEQVHVHVQTIPTIELFQMFLQAYPNACSLPTFYHYKPFEVRMKRLPSKADLLDLCPHCTIYKHLKVQNVLNPAENLLFKEKELHIQRSIQQTRFYIAEKRRILELLSKQMDKTTEVFIIQDFSKYNHKGKRYNDLMLSVLTYDHEKKCHKWIYLDFVQEGKGGFQDYYFVRSIWRYALGVDDDLPFIYASSSQPINPQALFRDKIVTIFSDGAGQHFKQKKTMSFWVELQREFGVQLHIHFFASYHGHNVCDSHSSHMKRIILKKIRQLGQDIFVSVDQLKHAFGSLKNTHVFLLSENAISRIGGPPVLANILDRDLAGIRSFHHFMFRNEGDDQFLDCYVLSKDGEPSKSILLPSEDGMQQQEFLAVIRNQEVQEEMDTFTDTNEDDDYFPIRNDDENFIPAGEEQEEPERQQELDVDLLQYLEGEESDENLLTEDLFIPAAPTAIPPAQMVVQAIPIENPASQSRRSQSTIRKKKQTDFVFY